MRWFSGRLAGDAAIGGRNAVSNGLPESGADARTPRRIASSAVAGVA